MAKMVIGGERGSTTRRRRRAAAMLLLVSASLPVLAAEPQTLAPLEARITRLERQLESQALVDMVTRLDRLEQEVQMLRGQVEEQSHAIADLLQRQRDLYVDIDRRLSNLERGGVTPSPQVSAPAVTPDTAGGVGTDSVPAAGMATEEERAAYQQAFEHLRELHYPQAIAGFQAYLKQYPAGRYGVVAQYWLGEAYYAQRIFKQAIIEYRTLIQRYPDSPKLAEAMLKIGYSQYEQGDKAGAQKTLAELVQNFPASTEAAQANAFLQKLRGEGR